MTDQPSWVPPEVDTKRANVARVYDYWLGGSHNFLADQDVARAIAAVEPHTRMFAQAGRAFLGRAVRFLAAAGIRQFLDIGSGIPTEGNVHEVAQQAAPGARVVYADIDPVAIAHSKAILAGNSDATIIEGDLRDPDKILAHVEPHASRVVVLDLGAVPDIEYTGLKTLAELEATLRRGGREMRVAALNPAALAVLQRAPLGATLGRERMFFTVPQAVAAAMVEGSA